MPTLKERVQEYINEGYYERAIALLQTSNSPSAKALIEKLKKKIEEDDRPTPVSSGRRFNPFLAVVFFTLLFVVVGGGIYSVIANDRYQRDLERNSKITLAVWDICIDQFSGLTYRQKYTLDVIVSGCHDATDSIIVEKRFKLDQCYDAYHLIDTDFKRCLASLNMWFSEAWIEQANKGS